MKRILVLEPYYGGSHKLFLNGLQKTVTASYTFLTLPARKWKARMQLSAFWFVQKIDKMGVEERAFDTVLCSTFVDVAVLRSLVGMLKGWNPATRFCTYFHENQFAYPSQVQSVDSRQFTAINLNSAMASDSCAFNSHYNRDSFLDAIQLSLKRSADMRPLDCVDIIKKKSLVLYPGMDYSSIDSVADDEKKVRGSDNPPILVWNHRWEHDKGPELFFQALYTLQERGLAFRLIVMGQSFVNKPSCFEEAKRRLEKEIIHFGFAETREEYALFLHRADLIVSTAGHEFFGIAILEGIRAGCYPLLPEDLSYPELYDKEYLYKPGTLAVRLAAYLQHPVKLDTDLARDITYRFEWEQCRGRYIKWLFGH